MNHSDADHLDTDFEQRLASLTPIDPTSHRGIFFQAGFEAAATKHRQQQQVSRFFLLAACVGLLAMGGRILYTESGIGERQVANQTDDAKRAIVGGDREISVDDPGSNEFAPDNRIDNQLRDNPPIMTDRADSAFTEMAHSTVPTVWSPAVALRNFILVSDPMRRGGIEIHPSESSLEELVVFPHDKTAKPLEDSPSSTDVPSRQVDYTHLYRNPHAIERMFNDLL